MLSVSGLFADNMADALSQRNIVDAMLMSPDLLSVTRNASPAATPPSSDRYDCMRNKSIHLVRHLAKVCLHLQSRKSSYDIRRQVSRIRQ
jgi:hypothetical protein